MDQDSHGDSAQTEKPGRQNELSLGRHPDLLHLRQTVASLVYVVSGSRLCLLRAAFVLCAAV
jgi:hypothetical protein